MVIAIIAVLIAILLPVLQKARLRAQQLVCASNMRQIALACLTYAHDNKGILPIPSNGCENGQHGNPPPPYAAIFLADWGIYDYEQGSLCPYLGGPDSRRRVFSCPTDPDPRATTGWWTTGDGMGLRVWNYKRNFSYSFNLALALPNEWSPPSNFGGNSCGVHLAQIRQSSHKILVAEPEYPVYSTTEFFYVGWNGTVSIWYLATRHFGCANEAFVDGHVELLSPYVFQIETDPKDPGCGYIYRQRTAATWCLGERHKEYYLPRGFFGVIVMSYLGKVAERCSRAFHSFISLAETRTWFA